MLAPPPLPPSCLLAKALRNSGWGFVKWGPGPAQETTTGPRKSTHPLAPPTMHGVGVPSTTNLKGFGSICSRGRRALGLPSTVAPTRMDGTPLGTHGLPPTLCFGHVDPKQQDETELGTGGVSMQPSRYPVGASKHPQTSTTHFHPSWCRVGRYVAYN